ncbi:ATPase, T2SS/T4P/T4SS family [Chromobacterium vaccinii]|uniref:ATPase, T2SS/T4P/T4SS family n=1 Tax=Chromobacterium vaccinii TaxID=1108595 RepID=UPI003459641D
MTARDEHLIPITSLLDLQSNYGLPNKRLGAIIPPDLHEVLLDCETDNGRCLILHSVERRQILSDLRSLLADCQRRTPQVEIITIHVTHEVLNQAKDALAKHNLASQDDNRKQQDSDAISDFRNIIGWAAENGASDVHIEIMETQVQIRVRINGEVISYPLSLLNGEVTQERLLAAVRSAYNSLADKGSRTSNGDLPVADCASAAIPLDLAIGGHNRRYKLRMEFSPDHGGPTAVFRLSYLGRFNRLKPLRGNMKALKNILIEYGYFEDQADTIIDANGAKRGLFIVGGPVGSGKTTLLYTNLVITSSDDVISRSIEDPIEADLPGVRMTPVGVGTNMAALSHEDRVLHYGKFLRSGLRMDMDQMLIGEIRSKEMALAAQDLYQSGHAGLATIHIGSVFEIVDRLTSPTMGLDRDVVAREGFFRLVMVQELLPELCDCKLDAKSALIQDEYLTMLENLLAQYDKGLSIENVRFRNHNGCGNCMKATPGIKGRKAVAEILEDSAAMMKALRVRDFATAKRLFRLGRKPLNYQTGTGRTLYENALHKVISGSVDPRALEKTLRPFSKALREFELEKLAGEITNV